MEIDKLKMEYFKRKHMNVFKDVRLIDLEINSGCNRSCAFCCIPKEKKRVPLDKMEFLTYENFKNKILIKIPDSTKKFQFGGSSEPFWNRDSIYIIEELRNKFKQIQITGITNTDPFKRYGIEYINELFSKGLNYLHFDLYDDASIEWFKSHKEFLDKTINVVGYNRGINGYSYHGPKNKYIIATISKDFGFLNSQRVVTRTWSCMGGGATDEQWINYGGGIKQKKTLPWKRNCTYPLKMLMIRMNGDVGICCSDSSYSMSVGNVFKSDLTTLWQGDALNAIRFLLSQGRRDLIPTCSICNYKTFRDGLFPYWGRAMTIDEAKHIVEKEVEFKFTDLQKQNLKEVNNEI